MGIILLILFTASNCWAVQVTKDNGDIWDVQGNVSYLIKPGPQTKAEMDAQAAQFEEAQRQADEAQKQKDLQKEALEELANERIANKK